jgi:hypothetical protein
LKNRLPSGTLRERAASRTTSLLTSVSFAFAERLEEKRREKKRREEKRKEEKKRKGSR